MPKRATHNLPHKTSLYLDDATKENLTALIDKTGFSMQDIIRSSIRREYEMEIENRAITQRGASEIGTDIFRAQIRKDISEMVSEEMEKRMPLIEAVTAAKRKKDSEAA